MKCIKLLLFLLLPTFIIAQNAVITGVVIDVDNNPVSNTNISSKLSGTTTDENGFYLLQITADEEVTIAFSHVGYENIILKNIILNSNETFEFNPVLKVDVTQIDGITVTATGEKATTGILNIKPEIIRKIPGANAGVENILKLLPGVSSSNELSTQYNVRGGNFDENLVYVNEIEVYRPFLVRSGQQESLSFVNSDMVENVKFSSGGFQAKYGDKLSSVLDVNYKKPSSFGVQINASLIQASTTVEALSKNKKLSSISGIRYRNNSLLINSQETQTTVKPEIVDFQTYETYQFSKKFHLSFLGNIALNNYKNEPNTRTTNFGTINNPKTISIYYAGQENNSFNTALGAFKASYFVNDNLVLKLIPSLYHTVEEERSDVVSQYQLSDIDPISQESSNTTQLGTQFNRARNTLDALIFNLEHKGEFDKNEDAFEWGIKYSYEDIRDQIRESEFLDSIGYFVRPSDEIFTNNQPEEPFDTPIEALESIFATNYVTTNRLSGFIQYSKQTQWKSSEVYFNFGIRSQYWSVKNNTDSNSHVILSPRAQFAIKPNWEKDMLFKIATGIYHQPPFYRELRDFKGVVNTNVEAQKAFHAVLSNEYSFQLWDGPFKLTSDIYYKNLTNVNTYTVEDVRIRYVANNNAVGYAYGADFRLNGAFVPGTESWISIGYLKTEENSNNRGYIARPTDQRLKFGILFQDYIPTIPDVKMYLNLVYNTGVPGGSPNYADPYIFNNRLRDYKRADLGISYTFVSENKKATKIIWLNGFKELSGGFEIFNLFNTQNSITNTWVRDINSDQQFAVPNYLTSRLVNLKIQMRF
ncbi:TonB-dependent receptor [Cellulophaga baltica]|uniref:TonB-dependent receptor n=1 Tax=Cellulophaga TaxID=104264 RepID=UPI001C07856F|nr:MULTISPECIES: carboxypeptidase-like regulatory domain-containing protein [Cellulophaga]MBU2996597.1 TonB-dependent receptor [Cellulophaga baltica]MDO6767991.1 carboxypeptidase-like regulatory domain-containing protein [Cellulophaga sp. 1_MG-2023]